MADCAFPLQKAMGDEIPTLGRLREEGKNLLIFFDERGLFEDNSQLNE